MKNYYDLPTMFIANVELPDKIGRPMIFVDKESLEGAWCRIVNDFLGGYSFNILGVGTGYFRNGYFISSIEPELLFEKLEPLREKATGKARERIDYIFDNVKEDDNNVVIIGKLKQ